MNSDGQVQNAQIPSSQHAGDKFKTLQTGKFKTRGFLN
jgi:hypothetical protein